MTTRTKIVFMVFTAAIVATVAGGFIPWPT